MRPYKFLVMLVLALSVLAIKARDADACGRRGRVYSSGYYGGAYYGGGYRGGYFGRGYTYRPVYGYGGYGYGRGVGYYPGFYGVGIGFGGRYWRYEWLLDRQPVLLVRQEQHDRSYRTLPCRGTGSVRPLTSTRNSGGESKNRSMITPSTGRVSFLRAFPPCGLADYASAHAPTFVPGATMRISQATSTDSASGDRILPLRRSWPAAPAPPPGAP